MNNIARALAAASVALALCAQAQDTAALRRNLEQRLPTMGKIDEIARTPMPGVFEVRVGTDIYYSDADGNFVITGQMIDTKAQKNLTEERVEKLMSIDFDTLPFKDAFTIVRGNGKRRMAVFQDPNCPYCKRFEKDMLKVDNVTIHMFLYPILGNRSVEMSKQIWCSREKERVWENWMTKDQAIPGPGPASCDTAAITRNVEYGKKIRISGTPTIFFADGTRVPGAVGAAQVEKLLAQAK